MPLKFLALALCLSCVTPVAARAPRTHHVMFETEVNEDSVALFVSELSAAAAKGDPVVVEINTGGGSILAGIEMSKAIERTPVPVICVVDGMAASMGLVILQSCDVRVMTQRSLLMGHEAASMARGQPDEIEQTAKLLRKMSHAMAMQVTHRTKMSVEDYELLTAHGAMLWLTSDEALLFGFVDAVLPTTNAI